RVQGDRRGHRGPPGEVFRRSTIRDRRERGTRRVAAPARRRTPSAPRRMRLDKVHAGHPFRNKAMLTMMRVVMGHAPGVVRTMLYRKEFFGRPCSELTQQVMRGRSEWTVGERETFAAFVSRLNQCVF